MALPLLVPLVLAVVLFAPATLGGKVISAGGVVLQQPPYPPPTEPLPPADVLQSESGFVFEPDGLLVRRALRAGAPADLDDGDVGGRAAARRPAERAAVSAHVGRRGAPVRLVARVDQRPEARARRAWHLPAGARARAAPRAGPARRRVVRLRRVSGDLALAPARQRLRRAAVAAARSPRCARGRSNALFFPKHWGILGAGPANFAERTMYAGALPLLLAAAGLVAGRPRGPQLFFAGLAVVSLAVALDVFGVRAVRLPPAVSRSSLPDTRVEYSGPGGVVRAEVDGRERPIRAADLAFRAVAVPPGRHTVRFFYRPTSVITGGVLSLVALLAIVLCLIGLRRRGGSDRAA
jgi:hypothetical protein